MSKKLMTEEEVDLLIKQLSAEGKLQYMASSEADKAGYRAFLAQGIFVTRPTPQTITEGTKTLTEAEVDAALNGLSEKAKAVYDSFSDEDKKAFRDFLSTGKL